jgi:hypothetical protein
LGAEGLAIPPCEEFEKKQFHGAWPVREAREVLMPSAGRIVQLSPLHKLVAPGM